MGNRARPTNKCLNSKDFYNRTGRAQPRLCNIQLWSCGDGRTRATPGDATGQLPPLPAAPWSETLWHRASDKRVTAASQEEALRAEAALLLYVRRG